MKKVLIIVPLLLVVGSAATVGLSMAGIVNVPFLPFGKKKVKLPKDDAKGGPFKPYLALAPLLDRLAKEPPVKPPAPPGNTKTPPPADLGPGEAKLAVLWAEVPTDKLTAMVAKWPPASLGRIFAQMDEDAVAKLLATLPSDQAAAISKAVAAATVERAGKVRNDEPK